YVEISVGLSELPDDVMTRSAQGRHSFPELPQVLRSRLFYDPMADKLIFKGVSWDAGTGEPLLLPNVMTLLEKERIEDYNSEWSAAIGELFDKTRNPEGVNLNSYTTITNPFNSTLTHTPSEWNNLWGIALGLMDSDGELRPNRFVGRDMALTAGGAQGEGYLVLAENDDESLGSAPVALHVIRVAEGPYRGEIKVIKSDNVFDEKLTLRHSGDFGGEPDQLFFQWYYKPDTTGLPPLLPGSVQDASSEWVLFDEGFGMVDATIEGPGKLTLSDNWFMVRYYYGNYNNPGNSPAGVVYPSLADQPDTVDRDNFWSMWAGAPGGETAQLAEGWIKRVVADLNPLDARVDDFMNYATSTDVSVIHQLGERYEGDVALNATADNLNSMGLIEAYQTVLNRARDFSIDASPPVDYGPANNALLNAATRIADFHTILGNEAYADSMDPTTGFDSSAGVGHMASSLFAFQNQLDSLLQEELVLLRGRDNAFGTTRARPVYNRLIWNFTDGDGELAYVQTYNVFDWNDDGFIDELDSRYMYPQGHGDAWGHYLSAMKVWYGLLRHDFYTWEPRVESVLVGGSPVPVDYLDERKFAQTAAAKAKAGAEIVDMTYRGSYVEDPSGQWQGYKDTDSARSWGVDGWGRRAGQGAYFDWAVANALLPAEDPVDTHTGITRIDRTTVAELNAIASEYRTIQSQIDESDQGLNPLGLAKGVVPFDVNPEFPTAGRLAKTHFEQVYDRAVESLGNAKTLFDHATRYTAMLRQNEDSLASFKRGIEEQEQAYWNQLINIFGYPYEGDIGPGGTYASGYDGPDWIHFNYVDVPDLTGETLYETTYDQETVVWSAEFDYEQMDGSSYQFDDLLSFNEKLVYRKWGTDPGTGEEGWVVDIPFRTDVNSPWVSAPEEWGSRRAPGRIQNSLADLIKAHASYQRGLTELEGLLGVIDAQVQILEARHGVIAHQVEVKSDAHDAIIGYDSAMATARAAQIVFARIGESITSATDAIIAGLPDNLGFSNDVMAPVEAATKTATKVARWAMKIGEDAMIMTQYSLGVARDHEIMSRDSKLYIDDVRIEVQQMVKELETMESDVRAKIQELYVLQEVVIQSLGAYQAVLAEGERLLAEREMFRKRTAAIITDDRYKDLTFRVFRNDAVQKYRSTFDLASRYVYLAATAYDYETNLLATDVGSGREYLTSIVSERAPGVMIGGEPVVGEHGLADPLARLRQNFNVYSGQLGFNNPQIETNRFSMRHELFRLKEESDNVWRTELDGHIVSDLFEFPPFIRYCRPFAPKTTAPQPGIVIPFSTEINFGYNFFGWPLGGGDSSYAPSNFTTKIRSVGVWFKGYDNLALSATPRVYLVPVGADVLRPPSADSFTLREWNVVDQKLPVPFPVSDQDLIEPIWNPVSGTMTDEMYSIRRFSSFRAYPDNPAVSEAAIIEADSTMDTRLVCRSVWNTQWLLIIPGGTLLYDPYAGLDTFIQDVSDIKLFFQTYAYSGN
ncbi:MAG: hypothetical protein ACLFOY_02650, partial [Desulfatibacillaceae bacterium]